MTRRPKPLEDAAQPTRQLVANLSRLMDEREMTPHEVAAAADVHRSHLSLILSGARVVQLDTMVKLAGALGVEPAELLAGVRWCLTDAAAANSSAEDETAGVRAFSAGKLGTNLRRLREELVFRTACARRPSPGLSRVRSV